MLHSSFLFSQTKSKKWFHSSFPTSNFHILIASSSSLSSSSSSSSSSESLATHEETYSTFLRQCVETANLHHGRAVHAKLIKGYLQSSLFIYNHIMNMYVKCGDLVNGIQLFDEMPQRNVVTWSAIIAGFVQRNCPGEALSLFSRMHFAGAEPNAFTLVSAFHASSLSCDSTKLYQIYALVVRLGFVSNVFLMNAFMTSLIRHGRLGEAMRVFETCPDRDIVSWNAMMAGYLQFSYSGVPGFWCRMNKEGVKPDNYTFSSVLTGLAAVCDLKMGLQVHAILVKSGHGCEICVGNSLVDMYLKNQSLVDGFKAFHEMPCSDVHSWTQMAAGCLHCGEPSKALAVIEEMKVAGIQPNKFTLATLLSACANLVYLEEGKKAHGLRMKLGTNMDVCVDNALLDMYAKCGCMDGALGVFQSIQDRSIVSWTTMIMGYAQNGQAREALQTFDMMRKEGVEPNQITFICVLYACSQGGFIDEGWKYFSSMSRDHGIDPEEDHYACMVDLYGRAGRIKEAEDVILEMPFKPSVLVWQTLLGACRDHGDLDTGLRAAEHALNLEKKDPSTYVLLSNMFAGLSNWDGVGKLRKLMEYRDVRKMPGSSWMES